MKTLRHRISIVAVAIVCGYSSMCAQPEAAVGDVPCGEMRLAKFIILNVYPDTAVIQRAELFGVAAPEFFISQQAMPSRVAPGQEFTITVECRPLLPVKRIVTLQVVAEYPSGAPMSFPQFPISAKAAKPPLITVGATLQAFDSQPTTGIVTIKNPTPSAMMVRELRVVQPPIFVLQPTLPATIPSNGSLDVLVEFRPFALGSFQTQMLVFVNDCIVPDTVNLVCTNSATLLVDTVLELEMSNTIAEIDQRITKTFRRTRPLGRLGRTQQLSLDVSVPADGVVPLVGNAVYVAGPPAVWNFTIESTLPQDDTTVMGFPLHVVMGSSETVQVTVRSARVDGRTIDSLVVAGGLITVSGYCDQPKTRFFEASKSVGLLPQLPNPQPMGKVLWNLPRGQFMYGTLRVFDAQGNTMAFWQLPLHSDTAECWLPQGLFFVVLETGAQRQVQKIMLLP
jgi:hypothetical protein